MAIKRYDPHCEDLARYFLEYPHDLGEMLALAGVIQGAIENWQTHRKTCPHIAADSSGRCNFCGKVIPAFTEEERNDATDKS